MSAKQRCAIVRQQVALLTARRIGANIKTLCLERPEHVPFVDELIEALIAQADQPRSGVVRSRRSTGGSRDTSQESMVGAL